MEPHLRYQIQGTIAQGDFAVVFQALDQELGREVAIKQIHPQYLAEPAKLERYWQEANMLAQLEHPFVMSIYDIVRPRGWLVLELMRGSLRDRVAEHGIDVDYLRLVLKQTLHALAFLAKHGIVHGDVKPTNLLLDSAGRVKLGDFGIARKMTTGDGSVIKSTTKYMAPEVVADDFGQPGPHSDLYSLGFTAYELLCGPHFETLFPGMNMYGRDEQMAWLMWHTAKDRRLPEIDRVLEGVPKDLAQIIHKLIEKDPAQRFQTPEQVLEAFKAGGDLDDIAAEEAAAAELKEKQAKRTRTMAIGAVVLSMLLSVGIFFIPTKTIDPPQVEVRKPTEGVVRVLNIDKKELIFEPSDGEQNIRVTINPDVDSISLDGQKATLSDLQPGDQVKLSFLKNAEGEDVQLIEAERNIIFTKGRLKKVTLDERMLTMSIGDQGQEVTVYVPSNLPILFNGQKRFQGQLAKLQNLQPRDGLIVRHELEGGLNRARSLEVVRSMKVEARAVKLDAIARRVTFSQGRGRKILQETFPLAEDVQITLNGSATLKGEPVTLDDILIDDRLKVDHDTHIRRLSAYRQFSLTGSIRSVSAQQRRIVINNPTRGDVSFSLAPDCEVSLRPFGESVRLNFVRPRDLVKVIHESPDLNSPVALEIEVTASAADKGWGLIIAQDKYTNMPELGSAPGNTAGADAKTIEEGFLHRFRIPENHIIKSTNSSAAAVKQAVSSLASSAPASGELWVYISGYGFLDGLNQPWLAGSDFDPGRPNETGVPLRWIVQQLDRCPAKHKVILLDTLKGDAGTLKPASSADLAEALKKRPSRPVAATVAVLAGSERGGSRPVVDGQGVFASHVALAPGEPIDANNDSRIDVQELYGFVQGKLSSLGTTNPVLYLPDPTPPRFTEEAINALLALLGQLDRERLDKDELESLFQTAKAAASNQPETYTIHGLILVNAKKTTDAEAALQQAITQGGNYPPAHHALSWLHFRAGKVDAGVSDLTKMVSGIPVRQSGYSAYETQMFQWAGRLRGFAVFGSATKPSADAIRALEQLVAARGEEAKAAYSEGNELSREKVKILDTQIKETKKDNDKARLRGLKKFVGSYAELGVYQIAAYIRAEIQK